MPQEISSREKKHRQHKRKLAVTLIIDAIKRLPEMSSKSKVKTRILEFGTGNGFQVSYLQTLGEVVASDVYISGDVKSRYRSNFTKCDICAAPFGSNTFDLIFSNHVIEHITDMDCAFEELKRIGKADCIYAFTVPTALWFLLNIPSHYCGMFIRALGKLFRRGARDENMGEKADVSKATRRFGVQIWKAVLPRGHGRYTGFFNCLLNLRVKAWRDLFQSNNFKILQIKPLLFYAPSELPLVPTARLPVRYGLYSSVLFLLKRM